MLQNNLSKAINIYGIDTIKTLVRDLMSSRSTGRLIDSLNFQLKNTINGLMLELFGEDYINVIDKGRKPGKQPPINDIKKWVAIKGLPPAAAFPIAKKIGKFGIKPKKILDKISENNLNTNIFENAYYIDVVTYLNTNINL